MQFHGVRDGSSFFTIFSTFTKLAITAVRVWLDVIRKVAEALLQVHNTAFVHNDIKGNNVVLDNCDGIKYHLILFHFGKSSPVTGLEGSKNILADQQMRYEKEYPHIAQEIVEGKRGQSIGSDIFSLCHMTEIVPTNQAETPAQCTPESFGP